VDVARLQLHDVDLGDRPQTLEMARLQHGPLPQLGPKVVHKHATLDVTGRQRRAG
jgi:hypothetical protein